MEENYFFYIILSAEEMLEWNIFIYNLKWNIMYNRNTFNLETLMRNLRKFRSDSHC